MTCLPANIKSWAYRQFLSTRAANACDDEDLAPTARPAYKPRYADRDARLSVPIASQRTELLAEIQARRRSLAEASLPEHMHPNANIESRRASARLSMMNMPSIEEVAGGTVGPSGGARRARAEYLAGRPRPMSMPLFGSPLAAGPSRAEVLKRANSQLELDRLRESDEERPAERRVVSFHATPSSDPEEAALATKRQDLRLDNYDDFLEDIGAILLAQGLDISNMFGRRAPPDSADARKGVAFSTSREEQPLHSKRNSFGGLTSKSTASLPAAADLDSKPEPARRESGLAVPGATRRLKSAMKKPSATSPTPPARPKSYFGHGSLPDRRLEPDPQSIIQATAGFRESMPAAQGTPRRVRPASVVQPRRYFSHESVPSLRPDKGKGPVRPLSNDCTRTPSPMVSADGSTPDPSEAGNGEREQSSADTTPRSSSAQSHEQAKAGSQCAEDGSGELRT